MAAQSPLRLFEGFGIELEYMIVHRDTLNVLPITDQVLHAVAGEFVPEVEMGELAWSNELVLHVIEIKTNGPARSLADLAGKFQTDVNRINALLEPMSGCLMPAAMHPWMDPQSETRLWPHEYNRVYEAFNRIFKCEGHGWSNLQSLHINLPFAGDEEFARLHAAIRLLMPIMPALTASSPILESKRTGILDNRLDVYRTNAKRIPSVSGLVIPEPVFSKAAYEEEIFKKMYRDIAPFDPDKILQFEWLNARGAIARFDRNAIEIRVLDVQECPAADLAISQAIVAVLKAMVAEKWTTLEQQKSWLVAPLAKMLLDTIVNADHTLLIDRAYLESFGYDSSGECTAGELWQHLIESTLPQRSPELRVILENGTLSRRILKAAGDADSHERHLQIYHELCECLRQGRMFGVS